MLWMICMWHSVSTFLAYTTQCKAIFTSKDRIKFAYIRDVHDGSLQVASLQHNVFACMKLTTSIAQGCFFFAGGHSWHLFGETSVKIAVSLANDGELVKSENFHLDSESENLLIDLCELGFVYLEQNVVIKR